MNKIRWDENMGLRCMQVLRINGSNETIGSTFKSQPETSNKKSEQISPDKHEVTEKNLGESALENHNVNATSQYNGNMIEVTTTSDDNFYSKSNYFNCFENSPYPQYDGTMVGQTILCEVVF